MNHRKSSKNNAKLFRASSAALFLAIASLSQAADITWADNGAAGSKNWYTAANWVGGAAPLNAFSGTTDNAIFTTVAALTQPNVSTQTRIGGVDFRMAAGGLAMTSSGTSGNLFQVGAGGIDSSLQTSGTNTITNARIASSATSTWNLFSAVDTASTSTFTFDSTVDLASGLTVIGQRNSAANNVGVINFERAITNTGALTINSSNINNTVNLKGVNTYTGGTTVSTGLVNVQNDQTLANGGWSIVSLSGSGATQAATVSFAALSKVAVDSTKKIQLGTTANGGTYANSTLNVAGTVINNGTLQLERAGVLNLNSGAVWSQSGNLTVTARGSASSTLNVNTGSELTYTGSTTVKLNSAGGSSGTGSLTIDGTGRFTTGAGFENLNTLTTGSGVSRVRLSNGGTLRLSADVEALTTQTRFDLGTGGGVIDTNGFSTTLSGKTTVGSSTTAAGITGTGSLTKSGAGTLTLSDANTYSGATIASAGKLSIGSTGTINSTSGVSIGAGEFNYNSVTALSKGVSFSGTGGILSGTGTISSAVTITSGNTLAAGADAASIGTLSFGSNLTGVAGATFSLQLNSNALSSDRFTVTGVANLGSATLSLFDLGSATLTNSETFTLLTASSVTGTFLGLTEGSALKVGNTDFTISYLSNSVTLTASAIPEPSTYAALAGLGVLILAASRRRKSV